MTYRNERKRERSEHLLSHDMSATESGSAKHADAERQDSGACPGTKGSAHLLSRERSDTDAKRVTNSKTCRYMQKWRILWKEDV